MIDGLYKVQFKSPLGEGSGVVFARDGKLWGGDSEMYYSGNYKVDGDRATARITTSRHTGRQGAWTVVGTDEATLDIQILVTSGSLVLNGRTTQAPGAAVELTMTKLCD